MEISVSEFVASSSVCGISSTSTSLDLLVINHQELIVHAKVHIFDKATVAWPIYLSTHLNPRIQRCVAGEHRQAIDTISSFPFARDDGIYRPQQCKRFHAYLGPACAEVNEDTFSSGSYGIFWVLFLRGDRCNIGKYFKHCFGINVRGHGIGFTFALILAPGLSLMLSIMWVSL